jgi:hypothetical protein
MKRLAVLSLATVLVLGLAASAMALPFPITDVRALGMGGAFVAAGEGIGAVNYNPALLGKSSTVGVVLPEVVGRIEDHVGMVDLIDDLNDPALSVTGATNILNRLSEGGTTDISAYGGIGAGFGIFGINAGVTYADLIYGIAMPSVNDTTSPAPGANTLDFIGIDARQVIFTGAMSFGDLIVGANLRNINATVFTDSQPLDENPDIGIGDVTEGKETEESATVFDVGAVFSLTTVVDVAGVARDVGGTDLGNVTFDPRYRIGAAFHLPTITVAADYDISEVAIDTVLGDGTPYQEWAIGAEFDIWAIALRTGLSKNAGLSGAPTLLHFGLGLGFLDFGVAYAEKGDYYIAGINMELGF